MAFQLNTSRPGYSWNNLAWKCPAHRLGLVGWVWPWDPDY